MISLQGNSSSVFVFHFRKKHPFLRFDKKMADGTQEVEQRRCQVFQVSYCVTKTSDAEALRAETGSQGFSSLTFSNGFIMTDK